MDSIYKQIIDESPVAYIHIKYIQSKNNIIEVIESNESFNTLFRLKPTQITNKELNSKVLEEELVESLNVAKRDKKCTIQKYIIEIDQCVNIDIYYIGDDKYILRFVELKDDTRQGYRINEVPFAAWIKDKNGRYTNVNKKVLELVNKTYDEVIGKDCFEVWGENIGQRVFHVDQHVMDADKVMMIEEHHQFEGVEGSYWQIIKLPYKDKDNDNETIGTMGTVIDVTENVKLRKKIEKNEDVFLKMTEYMEEVFFITDKDKAVYVSPSFEQVLEESPEEFYKDSNALFEYFDGADIKQIGVTSEGEVYSVVFKCKQNPEKWLLCKIISLKNENNEVIKNVGVISDITEKKRLENESEELRMSFFANLSHELRTPLNLIFSCIKVIDYRVEQLEEKDREFLKKYLSILDKNSLRLLKLVNNLIDVTLLDSGCFNYNPKNYNIVEFIENICISVNDFVQLNNLKMIFDTNVEEKIISFDSYSMEKMILNLISNAIKFNKPGGTIEVNITCEEDVKISVKDSGSGIPKNMLEKIFDPFEQVKSKFTSKPEGGGVGLSLTKSWVEKHNGTINVKSKLGEGSEFTIILPDVLVENGDYKEENMKYTPKDIVCMDAEFSDICV